MEVIRKSRFTRSVVFGVGAVLLLTSCGGGGGGGGDDSSSAPLLAEAVATTMRPTTDGYSFANFTATSTPEEFGSADLVAMFGEGACVGGVVDPCEPIAEAAAWARMVNQARASGHCEGLVVEASKRFNKAAVPQTVELKNEGEATHQILQMFATQFLKETQDETVSWQKKSLRQIVDELGASLKTGALKYSMGLYSDTGGHAVLPYAIDFTDPDNAVVHLYDSNWPGKDRYVEIDLKAKTWKFSFSGSDPANDPKAWTGGAGDIDLTSLDVRSNSLCPFCVTETKVKNSMLVIKSTDTQWSITTDRGTYSPGNNTLIPGISSRPIKGSAGSASSGNEALEFVVFVEGTDMKMNFPSPTSAFVSQGTAVVQLVSSESSDAEVKVSSASVSVNDPNMTVTVASENLVAAVAGNNTVVDIGAARLNIATESASGQKLALVADAQRPQIGARAIAPDGSSGGPGFIYTTRGPDDRTQEYKVSGKGVETFRVVEQRFDLNGVTAMLPPGLDVVNVRGGLPPPGDRDLSNPMYVAGPVFMPMSGVVASRLEGSRACDVPGYPPDWIIQAPATSCTAPVLQLAAPNAQTRNTVGENCSVGGVSGTWTAFGGSGTTICTPRIGSSTARTTNQNIPGQPCSEYGISGTWQYVNGPITLSCSPNAGYTTPMSGGPITQSTMYVAPPTGGPVSGGPVSPTTAYVAPPTGRAASGGPITQTTAYVAPPTGGAASGGPITQTTAYVAPPTGGTVSAGPTTPTTVYSAGPTTPTTVYSAGPTTPTTTYMGSTTTTMSPSSCTPALPFLWSDGTCRLTRQP